MLDAENSGRFLLKERLSFAQQTQQKSSVAMTEGSIEIGKDAHIVIYDKDKDFSNQCKQYAFGL